jgi:hypothetical protein
MGPKALKDCMRIMAPTRRPLFIWGPPGIGKSSIGRQAADEMKVEFLDVRCLLHDPSDLKFPIVDSKKEEVKWVNSIFPRDKNWKGIIALEEIDKCGPMMQGALLQPVLDRRIGEHLIPDGAWFIMIGNRMEDKAGGHQIITPMRSRCIHIDLDVSSDDWNDWAVEHDIDFRVRTFATKIAPQLLFKFDSDQRSSPNPRSWEFVSDIRKAYGSLKVGQKANEDTIKALAMFDPIAGAVGEGAAATFLAYCRIADNLPDVDAEILGNPDKAPVPESPEVLWAICGAVVERVRAAGPGGPKVASKAFKYAARLMDEYAVMLGKDLIRACPAASTVPEATTWVRKHRYTIVEANQQQ